MAPIQEMVSQLIGTLKEEQRVGLITFDRYAHLYSLGSKITTVHSFSGSDLCTLEKVVAWLGTS